MKVLIAETLDRLLLQEDTDGDRRITVRDRGPRHFEVLSPERESFMLQGVFQLSNLLQDLAWARESGLDTCDLTREGLAEKATSRISRVIRERCWKGLTRRLDGASLETVLHDQKGDGHPRLFLSPRDRVGQRFYTALRREHEFELITLPQVITPEYVLSLNMKPGLLGLAFDGGGQPLPYVVPGGRFNEMYGWDSYFIGLGLLEDGEVGLARNLVDHMVFQINHYGKILNANRTYYLTRSQPPFLTSFARRVYQTGQASKDWLSITLQAAMDEYASVWMGPTRLTECGLSRYFGSGIGIPPETQLRHYGDIMKPFAQAAGLTVEQYRLAYQRREFAPPELDRYFCEDRSVRESGHDTSYRLEGISTQLCPVDLNSLLYRYEVDLAELLEEHFGGSLAGYAPASEWRERSRQRQSLLHKLCWDSERGQFFDYNFKSRHSTGFESCTNLFPLWAGLATPEQAQLLVAKALPRLLEAGGLAGSSESSRGALSAQRTARQWDYPYGWAPHQMLIWEGLKNYGFAALASDLATRWLAMMTRNAVDFNGVIPEKFDVVSCSHEVFAEYSNQGADFAYLTREGFGWTNSSYQVGLQYLSTEQRHRLDQMSLADHSLLAP